MLLSLISEVRKVFQIMKQIILNQAKNELKPLLDNVTKNDEVTIIKRSNGDDAVVMS